MEITVDLKNCADCKIQKPIAEFGKMKQTKDGLHSYCKECISSRGKEYRLRNREAVKERKKKYANSEAGKKTKRESYLRNIENTREYDRFRFQRDKEKIYKRRKKYMPGYRLRNPGLAAAYSSLYRGLKNKASAILTKAMKLEIKKIHRKCKLKFKETGIEHHVDHIIPIKNDLVCGLHVPWNLQIITGSENQSKLNKFDGTYENESWRYDLQEIEQTSIY